MLESGACLALQLLQPAVAITTAATYLNGTLFSWHPSLMSVGFLGLVGQGILTAHSARGLQGAERSRLLTQHALWIAATFTLFFNCPQLRVWLGQVAGLALVAIAIWAVYQSKEIRGTPHFTNLHSWTGLATLALATLTPIGGALAFGKTGLLQLFPKGLQPVVKTAHRNAGVVTILVATAAMELGLAMPTAYQGALSRWMQVIIGIVAALIAYRAWCSDPEAPRSKAQ